MPWFSSTFLASRELRLSHARGHRLESCRDHSQNAATRHANCLIAPTGRTRRDPDHLQPASFGAVLGTATAGGPDASPTVLAALFRFPRWASLGPGLALVPRHTRLHHCVRPAAGEAVRDGAGAGGAPSRQRRPAVQLLPGLVQRRRFAALRLPAR